MSNFTNRNWVFMDAGDTFIYGYPTLFDAVMDCWKQENSTIEKRQVKDVVNQFLKDNPRNDYHTQDKFEDYLKTLYSFILDRLNFPGDHQFYSEVLWEEWKSGRRLRLFDDVLPALKQLKDAHYSLGIITNWDTSFINTLTRLGVEHFFDVKVVSCIEQVGKPDPKIFDIAMNRANTNYEQCWYIGDHTDYDIKPAKQLGMKTVQVDYYQKCLIYDIPYFYTHSFSLGVDRIIKDMNAKV